MHIVFKNLTPVKKESSKLHKAAKSVGLKSNLSICQNTIAEAYGWKNYNEMSLMHERICRAGSLNQLVASGTIEVTGQFRGASGVFRDMKVAAALSGKEKMHLDARLRASVMSLAKKLNADDISKDELMLAFFNGKGLVKKYFSSEDKYSITSLNAISDEEYKNGTLLSSGSDMQKLSFYLGMPLQKAIEHGGTFFLSQYLAHEFCCSARSIDNDVKINVIDISKHDGKYDHYFDADVIDYDVLRYASRFTSPILSYIKVHLFDNGSNMTPDLREKYSLFSRFLESYGECTDRFSDGMSLSRAFNSKFKDLDAQAIDMVDKKDIEDFVVGNMISPRGFVESGSAWESALKDKGWLADYHKNERVPEEALEFGLFVIKNIASFKSAFMNKHGRPSLKEGCTIQSLLMNKEIVVISFDPNDEEQSLVTKSLLMELRSTVITPCLGSPVESGKDEVISSERVLPPLKGSVLVMDSYESYVSKGMAVVTAQLRALGIYTIFNVSSEMKEREEWCSLVVNIGVSIILSMPYDLKNDLIRHTGVLKDKKVQEYLLKQVNSRSCVLDEEGVIIVSIMSRLRYLATEWVHSVVKFP
jgi:hypothetical protein